MHTEYIGYTDGPLACEAYAACGDPGPAKRPCVIVSHAWGGQLDFEREKARRLAEMGYLGFAVDLYGKGVRGAPAGDNSKLMQPFLEDRAMLRRRLLASLAAA
ncbi:MAG: dienelactone hydrolase family protein, partial [Candidatus Tectomicrobia bacterium]|nr:dienelactone hydrolase family protein [Candidatus Tectomicrobia bacterium]